MRTCPQCGSQYTDDTLSFCLQDGTPLTGAKTTDTPTAVLSEEEITRVRASSGPGPGAWRPSEVTRIQSVEQPVRRAGGGLAAGIVTIVVVAVLGVAGVIGLLIWQNSGRPVLTNTVPNSDRTNGASRTTGTATPASSPMSNSNIFTQDPQTNSNTATNTGTSGSDPSQTKNDVSQRVYDHCKSSIEAHDLERHMSDYASTVDFYNSRGASVSLVRSVKAKAFNSYPTMRVNVSNVNVTVDSAGDSAVATFDKEWTFTGADTNAGKVRSELRFRLIGGRWLITGERDLKVYYTR